MRAAHLLLEQSLPEKFRGRLTDYTAKGIGKFMEDVAAEAPEDYARVVQAVGDVGRFATWRQGDSIRLSDLETPFDKADLMKKMDEELQQLDSAHLAPDDLKRERTKIWLKYNDLLQTETTRGATAAGNPFAQSVLSGARGKMPQLKAMVGAPGLYQDHFGGIVPVFARRAFTEGVRPIDYLASTFGARTTVTTAKANTARGGYLGKLAASNTSNLPVTVKDCGTANGIDLSPDDESLTGRVLLAPVGEYGAGTLINAKIARAIRKEAPAAVLVRSALTCQAENGLCAKCAGAAPGGKLPSIGDSVGITAGQALHEPVIQSALCLAEGTLVRMADLSVCPIQDLRPGDMVLGADKTGHTFPVRVKRLFDQGQQQVQRRKFTVGQSKWTLTLDSTDGHKMLAMTKSYGAVHTKSNGVKRIMTAGTKHNTFFAVLPSSCALPGLADEPFALLLGVFAGDGNRLANILHQVTISCADLTQIDDLNKVYEVHNLNLVKATRRYDWRVSQIEDTNPRDPKTGRTVAGIRNPFKAKLAEYGYVGSYAHEKRLPRQAWLWSDTSLLNFIAGYLATDGSIYTTADAYTHFSFSSTSKELLQDLSDILRIRFGVYTRSVTKVVEAGKKNHVRAMWATSVADAVQVRKLACLLAPYVPGVKRAKVKRAAENMRKGRRAEDYMTAKRKTTEELGQVHCWDIEVDHPDHLFVLGNGLIVSNSSKHLGGAATGKKEFSGLKAIESFLQMPDEYPDKATVAEHDGRVEKVEDAPQGGKLITIAGQEHYVPQGLDLNVKAGDTVEAGDALSDGLISPADVIRLKGLGEGRRYYAERYKKILDDSGYKANLRNTEAFARAAIDHVEVGDDGVADYLPDDVVSYNRVAALYTPPDDAEDKPLGHGLLGKYLQAPALHYSIGTRITPSVLKRLDRAHVSRVTVSNDDTTPFKPVGNRLATATSAGDDWLAKQQSSYLGANLADDALRGRDTNIESNVHWAPRLAYGKDFGKNVTTTGKF